MALNKKKLSNGNSSDGDLITGSINSIANGTEMEGDIKSSGDLRIDGKIVGTIDLKGRLVVGKTGYIDGEVNCSNCDVQGTIKGILNVKGQLSLKNSASVSGDITTGKLSIEPGATFNVSCKMSEENYETSKSGK